MLAGHSLKLGWVGILGVKAADSIFRLPETQATCFQPLAMPELYLPSTVAGCGPGHLRAYIRIAAGRSQSRSGPHKTYLAVNQHKTELSLRFYTFRPTSVSKFFFCSNDSGYYFQVPFCEPHPPFRTGMYHAHFYFSYKFSLA